MSRKVFYLSLSILTLLVVGGLVFAQNVDTTKGWHALSQVAKTSNDPTSVDENGNGVIDEAEVAQTVRCSNGDVDIANCDDISVDPSVFRIIVDSGVENVEVTCG